LRGWIAHLQLVEVFRGSEECLRIVEGQAIISSRNLALILHARRHEHAPRKAKT
jgi:hypothetical protein